MQDKHFTKAALLALGIVILTLVSWEFFLRSKGLKPDYEDGGALWSDKRKMVYEPADKATVFIGSSRNKFDIDIPTWESLTGDHAIQLAIEGSSPLPILEDLALDEKFKGKLVIDVSEPLFFSLSPPSNGEPRDRIAYYKKETPAQRASFFINHVLESQLVLLDKENFSMEAMLKKQHIPDRPGFFALKIFPKEFSRVSFDRQDHMMPIFETDTSLQNEMKAVWDFYRSLSSGPPVHGPELDSIINVVAKQVNQIKARGGQVLFVRSPSSGPMWQGEQMGFPRDVYWDKLLVACNCKGIHFSDYPAINHFVCPEFSHLKAQDAITYTKAIVTIMRTEKGWTFQKSAPVQQ